MSIINSLPRISVIVPSYNQGAFLEQCIESIVNQGYPDLELIVMDGGSSDNSVEIIRGFEPALTYWCSESDDGQSAAINAGVFRATGQIVAWLNSDDLYFEDSLWIVGRAWAAHPKAGLYLGNGFRHDEATGERRRHNNRHTAMSRLALREGLDYVQQPSAFFSLEAWRSVGGLDENLNYCMDWDLLLKITSRYPTILINEILSVSREYSKTKTASGGLRRVQEICEMVERNTQRKITVGVSIYLVETALQLSASGDLDQSIRDRLYEVELESRRKLGKWGALFDGAPQDSDSGDITYLPFAQLNTQESKRCDGCCLPKITVVTPSFNQAQFLERTLNSIIAQNYPNLEVIVMDGGSTDGSVGIIAKYEPFLSHWESQGDLGPANAINRGFALATGEILVWLNSDDVFAHGAFNRIADAFMSDPELDMVFGDAMYVNADDEPQLVDHGDFKTTLYRGYLQPTDSIPAYWSYIHSVPQPTTYFRRHLLERAGPLNESFKFIFDFELFFRFMFHARKIRKIDRILAFYRIHAAAKTSGWSNFLVELYRFSRAWWPLNGQPNFVSTRDDFLSAFMDRYWGGRSRGLLFRIHRAALAFVVTHRLANPEAMLARAQERQMRNVVVPLRPRLPQLAECVQTQAEPHPLIRRSLKYRILFCCYFLPRFPGMSGGEIRDFHIIRGLLAFSRVTVLAANNCEPTDLQKDPLAADLDAFYDPATIANCYPEHLKTDALRSMNNLSWRVMDRLRLSGWPVVGPKLPRDVGVSAKLSEANSMSLARKLLTEEDPHFVFISPQTNPLALFLNKQESTTRYIFATYDVESVRLRRLYRGRSPLRALGAFLERIRGERFEGRYIRRFDGIIAVSELDRQIFISKYGAEPRRVVVIENGVDTNYFKFTQRRLDAPLAVLFPAVFSYPPNHQAAIRLARSIMPLVWSSRPDAQLWLVGQNPGREVLSLADGKKIYVTGRVESVLPYIRQASVMCAPLEAGSGTKTKVIEAISAGLPVVCTRLAAEGLDIQHGEHALIDDTDEGMASAILRLSRDADLVEAIATSGRQTAEAVYSWDSVLPKLEPWLDAISALPRVMAGSRCDETMKKVAGRWVNRSPH